jgi:glycosyltransferase involved in cell wall biosynthesis
LVSGVVAFLFARLLKLGFVFISAFPSEDLRLHALSRGDLRFGTFRKIILLFKKKLKLELLKRADLVFSKSEKFSETLTRSGIHTNKIVTIPMGYSSTTVVAKKDREKVINDFGNNSSGIILYFGAMDPYRNLQFLMDSFSNLLKLIPGTNLIMLGGIHSEIRALQQCEAYKTNAKHIFFPGKVDHNDVPSFIAASDVCVSPIPPIPVYAISSPTKVVESLGMGTPVVANKEIHDQRKVVVESGGGYCPSYDQIDFSESLAKLLVDPAKAREMGRKGRAYILRHRDYDVLTDKVSQSMKDMLNR